MKRQILLSTILLLPLMIFTFGQSAAAQSGLGTVKGTIFIKNVSGNNLGNFTCANLTVTVSDLESPPEKRWKKTTTATGDFSTRKCAYKVLRVPANKSFTASVSANFPNGCDHKSFQADALFPTKINSYQTLTFNFTITKISCTVVK